MAEKSAPSLSADAQRSDVAQLLATRRAIVACSLGQIFEIFDFVIYAYFASAIGKAFFPSGDPATELLNSLLTYGVGFLARPLGAIVIGYFGDRYGRRRALVVTVGLMALATGLTGLAPSYATAGLVGPITLVACQIGRAHV